MVHKFFLNSVYIALDVNSGAVHVLDEIAYDILDNFEKTLSLNDVEASVGYLINLTPEHPKEEIHEAYLELCELHNQGLLFSSDDYETIAGAIADSSSPIKAICLHVSHDCNMHCKYCFASEGDFSMGRRLMDEDTAKKAIDFLIEKSYGRKNLEVDFFGGEPLMNFDVIKNTVEYARSKEKEFQKNFRFTVTTNGILLSDEKIDYINKEMSNVVLSIDGRKSVNDAMRKTPGGEGTYDLILPKFKRLASKRNERDFYVRGTFTADNLDFSKDAMHLFDLGFENVSIEPAVLSEDVPYALKKEHLVTIFKEYESLALKLIECEKEERGFNFFHFMLDLTQGPCVVKRLKGCGAGNEYVAITPQGDIYPCHQFVGTEQMKMGNIFGGTLDLDMKKTFSSLNVYKKEDCKNCWAKFYCSGGCHANNYLFSKDLFKPHEMSCEMEKKRLECAIMMKAVLAM